MKADVRCEQGFEREAEIEGGVPRGDSAGEDSTHGKSGVKTAGIALDEPGSDHSAQRMSPRDGAFRRANQLIEEIERLTRRKVRYIHQQPRPGDQLVYVTNCSRLERDTGWHPVSSVRQTLEHIYQFRKQNPHYFPMPVEEPIAGELVAETFPLQRTA